VRLTAILLLVLCLAAAGLTGYLYLTANITVTDIDCVAVDAGNQAEAFAELKAQIQNGTFTGTLFDASVPGEAEEYQFYTYTIHLRNDSFVSAEIAEAQVSPVGKDVLQAAETTAKKIPARGTGEIQATILTRKDMHNVREIMVTYYLWGLPFSARVTYSK